MRRNPKPLKKIEQINNAKKKSAKSRYLLAIFCSTKSTYVCSAILYWIYAAPCALQGQPRKTAPAIPGKHKLKNPYTEKIVFH